MRSFLLRQLKWTEQPSSIIKTNTLYWTLLNILNLYFVRQYFIFTY